MADVQATAAPEAVAPVVVEVMEPAASGLAVPETWAALAPTPELATAAYVLMVGLLYFAVVVGFSLLFLGVYRYTRWLVRRFRDGGSVRVPGWARLRAALAALKSGPGSAE